MPLIGVAVKPFQVAKRRLGLDASARSRIGRGVAAHTLRTAAAVSETVVVTDDNGVQAWAARLGFRSLQQALPGLNGAASSVTDEALRTDRSWLVVHADLPLLVPEDLKAVTESLARHRTVLAPSYDGGTSVLGGSGTFRFAYGPGSFRRHLAVADDPAVVVRLGLCLDLDAPPDLVATLRHGRGAWLRRLVQ